MNPNRAWRFAADVDAYPTAVPYFSIGNSPAHLKAATASGGTVIGILCGWL
jgi:hypothetical protein